MTLDKGDRWFDFAACAGQAPLFDAPATGRAGNRTRQELAAEAERIHRAKLICSRCTVRDACVADYRPGRDEGIRGGHVLPPLDKPRGQERKHGTEGGYKTHRRHGEEACYECREANRLARNERGWKTAS